MAGIIPRLPTTPNFFLDAILLVTVVAKYFSSNTFPENLFATSQRLSIPFPYLSKIILDYEQFGR
jgi:hypothetical protein